MQGRIINAEVVPAGSFLTVAATAGNTSITVNDATPFLDTGQVRITDGATEEVIGYTAINRTTEVITLVAGLANSYAIESSVRVYPSKEPRYVWVRLTDGRAIRAHLPFTYRDKVRLGARTEPNGERVEVNMAGAEPRVTNMPDETPVVDGGFIDPDTLPIPTLTDGNPPASSPTPTVQGGLGWLSIKWTGVANADPVTYEVHVSTVSGFSPTSGTKATETPGTVVFIRRLQDETPLAYDTNYYVKIIAKDADGEASASGQVGPTQIQRLVTTDMVDAIVTAAKIQAGAVAMAAFAAGIRPPRVVSTLPTLPDSTNWPQGDTVILTTDNKLYRSTGTAWTKAIDGAADIVADSITAAQLATGAVGMTEFAATIRPPRVVSTLPTLPDSTNWPQGDTVILTTDNKLYRSTGTAWTKAIDGAADIIADSITAGSIAAGAVSTSELAAGAVRADKLAVGNFENLSADPGFERNDSSWVAGAQGGGNAFVNGTTNPRSGLRSASRLGNAASSTRDYRNVTQHDCKPGDPFYAEAYFRTAAGGDNGTAKVGIEWLSSGGSVLSTSFGNAISPTVTYTLSSVTVNAPASAVYARIIVQATSHSTGTWYVDDTMLKRMTGATFIEDGAIVTNKLAANAVTAAKIEAGTVTAAEIAADTITAGQIAAGAIGASEIAAGAVRADKLAVGNFENLSADPGFERNDSSWVAGAQGGGNAFVNGTTNPRSGLRSASRLGNAASSTRDYRNVTQHDCKPTDPFYAEAYLRTAAGGDNGTAQVAIEWLDSALAILSTSLGNAISPGTSYTLSSVTVNAPASAVYARLIVRVNSHSTGTWYVDDTMLKRMTGATFIQDGAIVTNKIAADAVTATKILAGTINSAHIAADAITANHIAAATITAEELASLVLTATKIYSPATTGDRLEIGDGSFPLRYWDGSTVWFSVDTLGNVLAFSTRLSESHIEDFVEFQEMVDQSPVRQSAASASASGYGGASATWGAATTAGNLLLAAVSHLYEPNQSGQVISVPSGWTLMSGLTAGNEGIATNLYYIANAPPRSGAEVFNTQSYSYKPGNLLTLGPGATTVDEFALLDLNEYAELDSHDPIGSSVTVTVECKGDDAKLEIIRTDTLAVVASQTSTGNAQDSFYLIATFSPVAGITYDYRVTNLLAGQLQVGLMEWAQTTATTLHLLSYSGIVTQNPRDQWDTGNGTGTTITVGPTVATIQDNELAFGILAHREDAARSGGPTDSFTFIQTQSSGTGVEHLESHVYEKALTTVGTVDFDQAITASKNWAGIVVTLRATTPEPPPAEEDAVRLYATDRGGRAVLHTKDEYGLVQPLSLSGAKIYQQETSGDFNNTEVQITGADQVAYDTDGYYSSGGIFQVPRDGIYEVSAHMWALDAADSETVLKIYRGNAIAGSAVEELGRQQGRKAAGNYIDQEVHSTVILLANDYVTFSAYSDNPVGGGEHNLWLAIKYLGPLPAFTDPSSLSPMMWYDADDLDATLADGDAVGTWPDKSGNGHDMTQGTAGNKPVFKTSVVNGHDVVRFDGTDDFLALPNVMTAMTKGEVMIVVKFDSNDPADAQSGLWHFTTDGTNPHNHFPWGTDDQIYDGWGTTVRKTAGNPARNTNVWNLYGVWSAPGDWMNWLNKPTNWVGNTAGFLQHHTATNTVGFPAAPLLGRSTTPSNTPNLDGDVAELIIFDRKLTQVERWQMSRYLRDKYAIT